MPRVFFDCHVAAFCAVSKILAPRLVSCAAYQSSVESHKRCPSFLVTFFSFLADVSFLLNPTR